MNDIDKIIRDLNRYNDSWSAYVDLFPHLNEDQVREVMLSLNTR